MNIQENVLLKDHTTFKVGGPARYFTIATNQEEIIEGIKYANAHNVDYFILAGGSNLIVSESGIDALVIKVDLNKLEFKDNLVAVGSGVIMDHLVRETTNRGLAGLQWAGGLPGTVGGAIRGNAGAFQGEIKDTITSVISLDKQGEIIKRTKDECSFDYRTSFFKHSHEVILEAEFRLEAGDPQKLKAEAEEHRQYRRERHPLEYPSAGSIFKNVPVENVPKEYLDEFKEVIKNDPFPVVPTAYIISLVGLKGYQIGGAQISPKHPNYIVNLGNASAQDIVDLIDNVVNAVKNRFRINLEVEPMLVGFGQRFEWESN